MSSQVHSSVIHLHKDLSFSKCWNRNGLELDLFGASLLVDLNRPTSGMRRTRRRSAREKGRTGRWAEETETNEKGLHSCGNGGGRHGSKR